MLWHMPGRVGRAALTMLPGGDAVESEDAGLYCPVELQSILEKSFESMDKEVLQHLAGAPFLGSTAL